MTLNSDLQNFDLLDRGIPAPQDHALALRHAPRIRFDAREPFLPSVIGYTVFRATGDSPSFPRQISVESPAVAAIEYAVWWDWDIQHLYELEHIWVYVDAEDHVVNGDASWHGGFNNMRDASGQLPLDESGRLVVHSEPGKHAFAASPQPLLERKQETLAACGPRSGVMGVLVTPLFEGLIDQHSPNHNQLVHTYGEHHRFQPAFEWTLLCKLEDAVFVPWPQLKAWIPQRVAWICADLARLIPPAERRVLRIAHRGASAHAVENAPEALVAAAQLGADAVEVDLRFTADGVPVISHDDSLKRVHNIPGSVSDFTLSELQAQTSILSLEQSLEICRQHMLGLYLDIKALPRAALERVAGLVEHYGYLDYVIFAAFRPDWLADIKAYRPSAQTSILFHSTALDPVALARAIDADYVHPCWEDHPAPHTLLTEDWLARVRAADLGVVCWHEERPEVIAALQRLGVNGICSDTPERLLPQSGS